MINTLSKKNLSKIGWKGGRSTSIWIMSLNILFFFWTLPLTRFHLTLAIISLPQKTSHSSADTEPSPLSSMAEKIFDLSSGVG